MPNVNSDGFEIVEPAGAEETPAPSQKSYFPAPKSTRYENDDGFQIVATPEALPEPRKEEIGPVSYFDSLKNRVRQSEPARMLLGDTDLEREAAKEQGDRPKRGVTELPGTAFALAGRILKGLASARGVPGDGKDPFEDIKAAWTTPVDEPLPVEQQLAKEKGVIPAVEKGALGLVGMLPELYFARGAGGGASAYAGTFGATTWAQTRDPKSTALSVALGYFFPMADSLGLKFSQRLIGWLEGGGRELTELQKKALETAGRQVGVNTLANLVNTPEYIADPDRAFDKFIETSVQNFAFAVPELKGLMTPKDLSITTQQLKADAERVKQRGEASKQEFESQLMNFRRVANPTWKITEDSDVARTTRRIIGQVETEKGAQNAKGTGTPIETPGAEAPLGEEAGGGLRVRGAAKDRLETIARETQAAGSAPPEEIIANARPKLEENMQGRTMNVQESDLNKPSAHLENIFGKAAPTFQQLIDAGLLETTEPGAPRQQGEVGVRVKSAIRPSVAKEIAPDASLTVTVQSPQKLGDKTVPGFIQVDNVSNGQNKWSRNPETLKSEGYDIPTSEEFQKLPQGSYTMAEAKAKLKELSEESPGQKEQRHLNELWSDRTPIGYAKTDLYGTVEVMSDSAAGPNNLLVKTQNGQVEKIPTLRSQTLIEAIPEDKKQIDDFLSRKSKPTQEQQIIDVLKSGPRSYKDIADELDLIDKSVSRVLSQGTLKGKFQRLAPGVYALANENGSFIYVRSTDSIAALPELAKRGVKADFLFLDPPYKTSAMTGGNRKFTKYALISPDQFNTVVEAAAQMMRTPDSPVYYMFSKAPSGMPEMDRYTAVFENNGFNLVATGEWKKTTKAGELHINVRGEPAAPEGIALFTLSGKVSGVEQAPGLDFTITRPPVAGAEGRQAQKPLELYSKLLGFHTEDVAPEQRPKFVTVDPFAGTLGLAQAAKREGVSNISFDIDEAALQRFIGRVESTRGPEPPPEGGQPTPPTKPTGPVVQDVGQTILAGSGTRRVSDSELMLQPELMQFKQFTNAETGESESLSGKWNELYAGKLLLWEPKNPKQYGLTGKQKYIVANGHHRVAFARRQGVKGYDAQVLREADGYSVEDARRIAAEANIADGKGTIYDQVKFLRNVEKPRNADEEMGARERLGTLGRKAADIAFNATDDLYDLFINEKVSPEQAAAIANAAPKNQTAQVIGIRLALRGEEPEAIRARMEIERAKVAAPTQTDLLGQLIFADDNADRNADNLYKIRKELREKVASIRGAANKPEIATKLGLPVNDPEALQRKLVELQSELNQWNGEWWLSKELRETLANYGKETPKAPAPGQEDKPKRLGVATVWKSIPGARLVDDLLKMFKMERQITGKPVPGESGAKPWQSRENQVLSMARFLEERGRTKWEDVLEQDLLDWTKRYDEQRKGGQTKKYAVNQYIAAIRAVLKDLYGRREFRNVEGIILHESPALQSRRGTLEGEAKNVRGDASQILEFRNEKNNDLVTLLKPSPVKERNGDLTDALTWLIGNIGLRPESIVTIKANQWDPKTRTLKDVYLTGKQGATDTIEVSERAAAAIESYRRRTSDKFPGSQKLFPGIEKSSQVNNLISKKAERLGITTMTGDKVTAYSLRHAIMQHLLVDLKWSPEDASSIIYRATDIPLAKSTAKNYIYTRSMALESQRKLNAIFDEPNFFGKQDKPAASRTDISERFHAGDGLTRDEVSAAIKDVDTAGFKVKVIYSDDALALTKDPDSANWDGWFEKGQIYLVADKMNSGSGYAQSYERARKVLREEVAHGLFRTETGRKLVMQALSDGKLKLTEAERQKLLKEGYTESELLDEFLGKSARENREWWQRTIDNVREFLSKHGLANLSNEEVARILLKQIRRINSGEGNHSDASEAMASRESKLDAQINRLRELEQKRELTVAEHSKLRALETERGQQDLFAGASEGEGVAQRIKDLHKRANELDALASKEAENARGSVHRREEFSNNATTYAKESERVRSTALELERRYGPQEGYKLQGEVQGQPKRAAKKEGAQGDLFGDFAASRMGERERRIYTQVNGLRAGREYTPQRMEPIQDAIRADFFDSRVEVSDEATDRAWTLIRDLADPTTQGSIALELQNVLGPDRDAGIQIYVNEIKNYAVKMLVTGNRTLADFIVQNWNELPMSANIGKSAQARGMRAIQESDAYDLFSRMALLRRESSEAARKAMGVGPELWESLVRTLQNPGLNAEQTAGELGKLRIEGYTLSDLLYENGPQRPALDQLMRIAERDFGVDWDVVSSIARMANDAAREAAKEGVKYPLETQKGEIWESQAARIMENLRRILPPNANWRDILTKQGTKALADRFWKIMAGPRADRDPNVTTFEKIVSSELSRLLRQAMVDAGYESAASPKMSTAEKIMQFLGNDQLRADKLKLIDERVREDIASRPEEMADQLTELWDGVIGVMSESSASNVMGRRIVSEVLRGIKPNWQLALASDKNMTSLRNQVLGKIEARLRDVAPSAKRGELAEIETKLQDKELTQERRAELERVRDSLKGQVDSGEVPNLNPFLNLAGLMFDNIAGVRRMRRAAADALQNKLNDKNVTEKQLDRELERFETDQTEWLKPDGPRNIIKEIIKEWLNPPSNKAKPNTKTEYVNALEREFARVAPDAAMPDERGTSRTRRLADEVWNRKQALDAAKRQRAMEREQNKVAGAAEAEAKRIADKLEMTEFPGDKARRGIVEQTIKEFLTPKKVDRGGAGVDVLEPISDAVTSEVLAQKLIEVGVSPETAKRLAFDVYQSRQRKWQDARLRAQKFAAERGNLRNLIEAVLQTPYLAQKDPAWLKKTAVDWFKSSGLSQEQAEAASVAFQKEFQAKLVEAAEAAANRVLAGSLEPRGLDEIIKGIRAGLLDPDKTFSDKLAERGGWTPMSKEDLIKVATLEIKATDPALSPQEFAAVEEQMWAIFRNHGNKDPEGVYMRRLSEGFIASLLSGVRTVSVQFAPVMAAIRDFPIMALSDPKNTWRIATSMWRAARNVLGSEIKYAWQNDAYGFHLEALDREHKELKQWAEKLEKEYSETKNPIVKAGIRARQIYALQRFVSQTLSTLDQTMMAGTREWKLAYYSSLALKAAGLSTKQLGDLIDVVALARRSEFDRAKDEGIENDTQAKVRANWRIGEAVWQFVKNQTGSEIIANDVLRAAENDIYSIVGRRSPGITETHGEDFTAEGFASHYSGMNAFMQKMSEIRGAGGPPAILAVAGIGFLNVPFRTMRYFSSFSPYGLMRYGIYRYRTNRGMTNYWNQSFGNELQARARFREALAGTVVMLLATAWASMHHTTDDGAGDEPFGLYITGSGPSNKVLRDAFAKQGWKPYALNFVIAGHKVPIPLTRIGEALMFPFMLPAALDDAAWDKKTYAATGRETPPPIQMYANSLIGTFAYMSGQKGALQGITQFSQAIQGGSGTVKALAKLGSGAVSAAILPFKQLLASVSNMFVGPLDQSSASAIVAANFPIVGLPFQTKATNRFGDELYDQSWYGRLYNTGIPFAFQVSKTPDNEAIYKTLVEKGASPPELRRFNVEEKYGPLSDSQFKEFSKTSGEELKRRVLENVNQLNDASPDEAKKWLNKQATLSNRIAASDIGLVPKKLEQAAEASNPPKLPSALSAGSSSRSAPALATRSAVGSKRGLRRISLGRRTSRISRRRVSLGRTRLRLTASGKRRSRRIRLFA